MTFFYWLVFALVCGLTASLLYLCEFYRRVTKDDSEIRRAELIRRVIGR
jgi:uncharacterized ion transporter superfamily protein YfcC